MMATPTNAAHPRRLYNEMNASVTYLKHRVVRVNQGWTYYPLPEMGLK